MTTHRLGRVRRGFAIVLALSLSLSLTMAMPALAQSGAMATMMRVNDYRLYRTGMENGDKGSTQTLFNFLLGMQATLRASGDAYVARGAKRRICMPADAKSFDMIVAIDRELARNAALWDGRRDADIGLLVIAAFAERWPCK